MSIQRNAELILTRLSDYLSIRFDLACRINPQLKSIKQDLMFHELTNVRRCLSGEKMYGPSRMSVTEVFLGDDDKRRRNLMSASDQTSVQVELVSHCQDSKSESTRGQIRIHDLKGFYACLDPRISDLMDLVETWIWWDIYDAVEIVRFEQKMSMIQLARQGRLTDEIRKRYHAMIQATTTVNEDDPKAQQAQLPQHITDDDIIRYEWKQILHIRDQWHYRRGNERGFMYVLKRDEQAPKNLQAMLHQLAQLAREYEDIEGMDELSEEIRERYAAEVHLTPENVTQQSILEYLQNNFIQSERDMIQTADHDSRLGPPYNYKERQFEQIDKYIVDLGNQLKTILQPAAPAKPAAAPAANPAVPGAQPKPAAGGAPQPH